MLNVEKSIRNLYNIDLFPKLKEYQENFLAKTRRARDKISSMVIPNLRKYKWTSVAITNTAFWPLAFASRPFGISAPQDHPDLAALYFGIAAVGIAFTYLVDSGKLNEHDFEL